MFNFLSNKYKKFRQLYRSDFKIRDFVGKSNINLGCGNRPLPNFLNVDFYNKNHADIVFDIKQDWPIDEGSADLIFSDNVFEHFSDIISLVKKCHSCLRSGGHLVVKVPYFKSKHAFVDPTHVKFFTIQSMDYFVEGKYFNSEYKFIDECFSSIDIFLDPGSNSFLRKVIAPYALMRPNLFENSILSNLVVFHNIVYVLRK